MPKQNAMIAVGSIFLVAAIVAGGVAFTHHLKHLHDSPQQNQTGLTMLVGSVVPVCETMDHIKTLSQENVTMWRDLIQSQIKVAIDELNSVMKNTTAYKNLAKDPRRDRALRVCNYVLDLAMGDLRRSIDRLGALEFSKINQHITNDLRSWLRSSYSYAETCIDALNSNDMKGSKLEMENYLIASSAKEPVRNALVMADRFASTLKPVCTRTIKSRRLLAASASLALPLSQTR
ncbi:hypothetical protein QQ045_021692 [Rhodiola kirilowii]